MFGDLFGRKKPREQPLPEDPDALVALSDTLMGDPKKRRALIERAVALFPDSLKARYALLMLGDLGLGGRRQADLKQIKSYILTPFDRPGDFSEEEKKRLAREIFDHPLLAECLGMAGDRERFLRSYLNDLTDEYTELFITGASANSGAFLGFSTPASRLRGMSAPFARMLEGIGACPYLDGREREMLLDAAAASARRATGGDMSLILDALDGELKKELSERE